MPLIPYRPFEDIDDWFENSWPNLWGRMERRLGRTKEGLIVKAPKVNVFETEKEAVAEIELPGVEPANIDVEVKNNAIHIEAKTEHKKEEKEKDYYRQEMSAGYYKRIIPLPTEVDEQKATADYHQGMLKVTVPKLTDSQKKEKKVKIKVKTS